MASHLDRIERLARLVRLLPAGARAEDCPDPGVLLDRMASAYAACASDAARRRAIQRDLEELLRDGEIEAVNPGSKPLRYRRRRDSLQLDPYLLDYARKSMRSLVRDALPERGFERIWRHLLDAEDGFGLDEGRLRIIVDSQRLAPAEVSEAVLVDVLEALAVGRTLEIGYLDADGKRTQPVLHPQALLQRGPRIYLYALKNEEPAPVRMYALHRITRSRLGSGDARRDPGFDLQRAIDAGRADFGGGKLIELELRARGYVAELLRDCPLSDGQRVDDEPEGSDFDIRVWAAVPQTGQLLRWVLGFGDKVEVVAPGELRRVVASQLNRAVALYAN